jgi:hypothetical protein
MGTSLIPVGNHKIEFKDKTFETLANEIKQKLDEIKFENAAFLKETALNDWCNYPDIIMEIQTKNQWTVYESYDFSEDKALDFGSPFKYELRFDAYTIQFSGCGYRYWGWLELDHDIRNQWRKYYYQVIRAFGGDRVIYLADNSHPLEKFLYMNIPFEEVELKLTEAFGSPQKTFEEVDSNYEISFYVDRFEDLKGTE